MVKNITIIVLIIITLMSFVYAFFQQSAAEKARSQAERNLVLADEARREADANAFEARKQAQIAIETLKKCKEGK